MTALLGAAAGSPAFQCSRSTASEAASQEPLCSGSNKSYTVSELHCSRADEASSLSMLQQRGVHTEQSAQRRRCRLFQPVCREVSRYCMA